MDQAWLLTLISFQQGTKRLYPATGLSHGRLLLMLSEMQLYQVQLQCMGAVDSVVGGIRMEMNTQSDTMGIHILHW